MDRRSGIDSRSVEEKRLMGERRSGIDRRAPDQPRPSNDQLALFARRIRRVMRDEKSRYLLGVAVGEGHFAIYPDVVRVVEWIEQLAGSSQQSEPNEKRASLRRVDASLASPAE